MTPLPIWFRYSPKNSYSIAALLPLVEAGLARQPKEGIMLYSFATAQALAQAQKELRAQEKYQHPFHWAAFYMTGV